MRTRSSALLLACLLSIHISAQQQPGKSSRQKWLMDFDWKFAFGHPSDHAKDFNTGTGYFSWLAKAGYGDGAAKANFDDRAWRPVNLPHDWAAEQDVDPKGSFSHGFKAIGRNFPEKTIGWYRRSFFIPQSDTSLRIKLVFDGVFRNSTVWVNGHFLGTAASGYTGSEYDISEVISYGDSNIVAVRVDAGMEEGWFYEGAGIYRHVWMTKTDPVHVTSNGTFVQTLVNGDKATVTASAAIINESLKKQHVQIWQFVRNRAGEIIASSSRQSISPGPFEEKVITDTLLIHQPELWSVDSPYLYRLFTVILKEGNKTDEYQTTFGIREIRFDPKLGFFLNGKSIKLKGTNNHQDHAGVGTAIPDELQYWRIRQLKEMGSNAYRCAHHPPTPELLEACDSLGMLVIDENRLMQTTTTGHEEMKKMILRDRNHPSVICWSVGNEEWAIENNRTGERIALNLQAFAKSIDPTRPVTAGISGGFRSGISSVLEVMGYNYLGNGDIDAHAEAFPLQPGMGTEEGSTFATRGIYVEDKARQYQPAYDRKPRPGFYSIEEGWQFYERRPNLAGMFIWTGFDYRGEPTPYGYPSVTSYFGMMDLCGFPKDNVWYLRAWWQQQPVLHLLPHWNWQGMEGKEIRVVAYSNCDEVELTLNKKSLGRKKMPANGHLDWMVAYSPGTLEATGFRNGKKILSDKVNTTGRAKRIQLTAHKTSLTASGEDVAIITVNAMDEKGRAVPDAENDIDLAVSGPGRIIGVGNGNPTSLEKEKFTDSIRRIQVNIFAEKSLPAGSSSEQLLSSRDTAGWQKAFVERDYNHLAPVYVHRGMFELPAVTDNTSAAFYYKCISEKQSVYINGHLIAKDLPLNKEGYIFKLDAAVITPGNNRIEVVGSPIPKKNPWDEVNTDAGLIRLFTPAGQWHRKLFSGLAQVLVQTDRSAGDVQLKASSPGLEPAVLSIRTEEDTQKRYYH